MGWRSSVRGRTLRRGARIVTGAAMAVGLVATGVGTASAASPSEVVVGVDHFDPANQDPAKGRLFEYTDFFPRTLSVHQGEVVDFQTAPFAFHIVGIEQNEALARTVYPVATNDTGDPNAPSGSPKIVLGPSNFPILNGNVSGDLTGADFTRPNGPPLCGRPDLHEADCAFNNPSDIQVAGPNLVTDAQGNGLPTPADWRVKVNVPPGTYAFHCYIHPGMSGELNVVAASLPATTQAQIAAASAQQFAADQAEGVAAERAANRVRWSGGAPGTRTYVYWVGVGTADNKVAIDEIFPNVKTIPGGAPRIVQGDKIKFIWKDVHNVHTVFFPNTAHDVSPFGFDCDTGFTAPGNGPPCTETGEQGPPGPELIGDPGFTPPGTVLTHTRLDSGLRIGTGYDVAPQSQTWWLRTDSTTPAIRYTFKCAVHDFMVSSVIVGG